MTRRPWAWPLWPFYAAASGIKDALYTRNILHPKTLAHPALSIGSISAGGAGKTPAVIALTRLLQQANYQPDILSRGYGRSTQGVQQVDPTATTAATLYGDEPTLIARATGAPVWVSSQRHAAGLAAEARHTTSKGQRPANITAQPEGLGAGVEKDRALKTRPIASPRLPGTNQPPQTIHLLDDGFQHRKLARQIDIALVTLDDLSDELLPVGNLREAPYALHRADILIIRAEERKKILPRLRTMGALEGGLTIATPGGIRRRLRPMPPGSKPLWTLTRTLRFPSPLGVLPAGLRPLAFCAIARPEGFESMLRAAGCGVLDTLAFRDHHTYTQKDIVHILATAKKLNATGFLTTEKDAVKLTPAFRDQLEALGPLAVISLEATFEDAPAVLRDIEERLA